MIELARFSVDYDLRLLQRALIRNRIAHRIFEQGSEQIVAVDISTVPLAKQLLEDFGAGILSDADVKQPAISAPGVRIDLRGFPVTIGLIGLSWLGFTLVQLKLWPLVFMMLYQPAAFVAGGINFGEVADGLSAGQLWRLVSPIFLHFGILHVVFNSLWCWELGRRIESVESSQHLLMLVLVSALISNAAQYQIGGPSVFGGLSGVVYAFLGYCAISQWLSPQSSLTMPTSIYIIMVGFLLLGMTGLLGVLGGGAIANAAHVGGLLSGACWALIMRQFID